MFLHLGSSSQGTLEANLQEVYYAGQDLTKQGRYSEFELHNALILGYKLTKVCLTILNGVFGQRFA